MQAYLRPPWPNDYRSSTRRSYSGSKYRFTRTSGPHHTPSSNTVRRQSSSPFGTYDAELRWGAFFNRTAWAPETNGNATVFQTAGAANSETPLSLLTHSLSLRTMTSRFFDLVINKVRIFYFFFFFLAKPVLIHFSTQVKTMVIIPFHLHGHTVSIIGTGPGGYQGQS